MRTLRARDHVLMPWKNGTGETTEIAISPPGASIESFAWRVSMAKVMTSGPFSSFPGVDRTLAVLEGRMLIHVEGKADIHMDPHSEPIRFAGDVPTAATVLDPVTDLNLMVRRGTSSATLRRVEKFVRFGAEAETLLLLRASAVLTIGGPLASGDVLWLRPGEEATFETQVALGWAITVGSN